MATTAPPTFGRAFPAPRLCSTNNVMTREQEEQLHVARLVAVASAYEFIAICSQKRIPTLSRITWNIYGQWWGKLLVWLVLGWLTDHLLVSPEGDTFICVCTGESE